MWFHDEFLQALKTFVNVSTKKNWNFLNFFSILLFTRAHMSSGAETPRPYDKAKSAQGKKTQ